MLTEADTCRKYVLPKLLEAGWEQAPHSLAEQRSLTDGRIVVAGKHVSRRTPKRADYLLRYTRDFPLAVVEAKAAHKLPGDGLQQAKDYAEMLGLKFAYATNGHGIVEFDYLTGKERIVDTFPGPDELFARLREAEKISDATVNGLLTPSEHSSGIGERYYQQIAISRTIQAITKGRKRVLLTMATGTGKTMVAFQICWKLWNARWNAKGEFRRPKILYLADRNILIDDPKDKTFAPFGDARWKIENGIANQGRDIYFAIYQAIAEDEGREGLFRQYGRDFFDLIIVDECHRGSAREDSAWRDILEYFTPAYQLGMTATPARDDNRDSYRYFGRPIYQYSLRQGIDDGFLAPYRVHRVLTTWDAAGWRPSQDDLDRYGERIPDDEYHTPEFEKKVSLLKRTEAIAKHLADFMAGTDRFAKTIVFCVDQEHADEMRRALGNLNADLVRQYPDYVCRVTADEKEIGRGHLSNFQELETKTPVILTTSQLLTTGVDAPTCKNVVLARTIGSMTEFKQIIGRGTRVRDDYGKYFFNIIDYTGSATSLFADPDFDGPPESEDTLVMDEWGNDLSEPEDADGDVSDVAWPYQTDNPVGYDVDPTEFDPSVTARRKYYYDGGQVEIVAHFVQELDPDGHVLRTISYTEYTAESVRTLYPTASEMREQWADAERRKEIIAYLEQRGINFDALAEFTGQPDADPFDLLCNVAFNAPLRSRRERAERLRKERQEFFAQYGPEATQILEKLLEKYAEHGTAQFMMPEVLKVPPISEHGNVPEIATIFGGGDKLKEAVTRLQTLLYAA